MAKVKIISDPYNNKISYERMNTAGEWEPVANSNSKLLSEKLTRCVFPFNVKEIVDEKRSGYFQLGKEQV